MTLIVNFIYLLAIIAVSPVFLYRMLLHKRYRAGWRQRFGNVSRKDPSKKCFWLHAVSLGEINAAKSLITAIEKAYPDFEIAISSTTDTGFARAAELYKDKHNVFYFPLDLSFVMRRAFRQIQPTICILMELEVWYNFSHIAAEMGIPVVVANGRLSEKSFSRYKQIRPFIRPMFEKLALILAQTQEYADRFKTLGCPEKKVIVSGSLKYDTAQLTQSVEGAAELVEQIHLNKMPLLVAGGTGPGEEKIILDVYSKLKRNAKFKSLKLAIVPRKPERFDEVAQLISKSGFNFIRYSQIKSTQQKNATSADIILGDTMGDLRKFYAIANIIFAGRSLVPMGGSDMMEAVALNKCTIFGPYAFNFEQTVNALIAGNGAVMVKNKNELAEAIQTFLLNPEIAQRIAANGQNIIKQNQGATKISINAISRIVLGYSANQ